MAGSTGRTAASRTWFEWQQWAASSPYELALNSSFYGHNYPFREKRFEL
jgi:hypothetical protein